MVGAVVQGCLHADYGVSCQRSALNGFLDTLFHCREVVFRNGAAHNDLFEYIRRFRITGIFEAHLNVTVLTVSAGLLLIFCIHIRILADGLAERYLRACKLHIHFVFCQQLAHDDIKMLIAHAVDQRLTVFRVVDSLHGEILLHHLCERLGDLILLALVLCKVSLVGIRHGNIDARILDRRRLGGERFSGLCDVQLADRADIARVKLRHLNGPAAFHHIKLI